MQSPYDLNNIYFDEDYNCYMFNHSHLQCDNSDIVAEALEVLSDEFSVKIHPAYIDDVLSGLQTIGLDVVIKEPDTIAWS